jgi:CRP/FNR family transcriptional regulator, cyclic AMP receptor protein
MISPETLRRYPFFAGFSHDQLVTLAMMAEEQHVEVGHYFFHEGDALDAFYLMVKGQVAIVFEIPAREVTQSVAQQLTGAIQTSEVVISEVGAGEPFGWTAITALHTATAGAKAVFPCEVIAFDRAHLYTACEQDPAFGYRVLKQIVQVARQRLHDLRVESLAQVAG